MTGCGELMTQLRFWTTTSSRSDVGKTSLPTRTPAMFRKPPPGLPRTKTERKERELMRQSPREEQSKK